MRTCGMFCSFSLLVFSGFNCGVIYAGTKNTGIHYDRWLSPCHFCLHKSMCAATKSIL